MSPYCQATTPVQGVPAPVREFLKLAGEIRLHAHLAIRKEQHCRDEFRGLCERLNLADRMAFAGISTFEPVGFPEMNRLFRVAHKHCQAILEIVTLADLHGLLIGFDAREELLDDERLHDRYHELGEGLGDKCRELDKRDAQLVEALDDLIRAANALRAVAPPDPDQEHTTPDGPGPRFSFFWCGDSVSFAGAPLRYHLCKALWDSAHGAPHAERLVNDAIEHVYGDARNDDSERNLKDVIKQVNGAFQHKGWNLKITLTGGKIWLMAPSL